MPMFLIVLAVLWLVNLVVQILTVWLAGRIFKSPQASLVKVAAILSALGVLTVVLLALAIYSLPREQAAIALGAILVLGQLVPLLIYRQAFGFRWLFVFVTVMMTIATSGLVSTLVVWPLKTWVYEAYSLPTNSMAPTIVGKHYSMVCPHCQGELIVSEVPVEIRQAEEGAATSIGICRQCWQYTDATDLPKTAIPGDRVLVDKRRKPQRWDLVAYYPPKQADDNRRPLFVSRLVGFPGETLELVNGVLYINSARLAQPDALAQLRYEELDPRQGPDAKAMPANHKVTLADDECFVLSDRTRHAIDSRYLGPVPMKSITGVVDSIYWPREHWRTFPPLPDLIAAPPEPTWAEQVAAVRAGKQDTIVVEREAIGDAQLADLAGLERLLELEIGNHELTPAGIEQLKALPNFRRITLRGQPVNDALLQAIVAIPTLRYLNIPQTEITDQGLQALLKRPQLVQLRISSSKLTDASLATVVQLPKLRFLHLIDMPITDAGLDHLHAMTQLESLYIDGSPITDAGVERLLKQLPELHFHVDQQHHDRDPKRNTHTH